MAEMKSSPHQLRARRFSSKKERKASPSASPVEERRRSSVKRNDPFMKAHSSEVVTSRSTLVYIGPLSVCVCVCIETYPIG